MAGVANFGVRGIRRCSERAVLFRKRLLRFGKFGFRVGALGLAALSGSSWLNVGRGRLGRVEIG